MLTSPLNQSSWYQPQETVKWWYQTGVRTATMIAGADTPVHTFDMSAPNPETGLFYISTTYLYKTGQCRSISLLRCLPRLSRAPFYSRGSQDSTPSCPNRTATTDILIRVQQPQRASWRP